MTEPTDRPTYDVLRSLLVLGPTTRDARSGRNEDVTYIERHHARACTLSRS